MDERFGLPLGVGVHVGVFSPFLFAAELKEEVGGAPGDEGVEGKALLLKAVEEDLDLDLKKDILRDVVVAA